MSNSPAFDKHRGKINEYANTESRRKAADATNAVRAKKKAMRAALEMIMSLPADSRTQEMICKKYPMLSPKDVNGYVEAAALMRNHGQKNWQATAKLIEIMGGSVDKTAENVQKTVNIIVANPEDAKELADV